LNGTARIVILNGIGSVGKSSIAKALQTMTIEPFLHVQMDAFLEMLPEAYHDRPEGFVYRTSLEGGRPVVDIATGPVGEQLMRGMRHAIAAMAGQGNNLIVDEVMTKSDWAEYELLLAPFEVFMVGVFAPLDVLEARERQRGDRMIGLARRQYAYLHKDMAYDLEIDTTKAAPMECAALIKDKLGL
jgi:chloramphenicol 3-O phosphotransferase